MGYASAIGMVDEGRRQNVPQSHLIEWHLRANHYPPLPSELVAVAQRAIRKANRGDWDARVRFPKDCPVEHRRYGRLVPVSVIVESMHLEPFLREQD